MVSKIDICNLALAHLGQEPISSLTQEDERARRLNLFYEPVKAEVLRTHNWAFATVQEPLIRLEDPSAAPYPYLYQYPWRRFLCAKLRTPHLRAKNIRFGKSSAAA